VETTGEHRYDLHFHFAADACPVIETDAPGADATGLAKVVRERPDDKPGLEIFAFERAVGQVSNLPPQGVWRREDGWVSLCFGARIPAPVLVFSATGMGNQELVTFLVPRTVQAPKADIREIRARGGRAFTVQDGGVRDVLLIGSGLPVEAAQIVSDFEWTWARLKPASGAGKEFVLLGGSFLTVAGRDIFRVAERASFVVIRYLGEEAVIEQESGVRGQTEASARADS
jgi:hypothetical protein